VDDYSKRLDHGFMAWWPILSAALDDRVRKLGLEKGRPEQSLETCAHRAEL
jgi:hypothetical protein